MSEPFEAAPVLKPDLDPVRYFPRITSVAGGDRTNLGAAVALKHGTLCKDLAEPGLDLGHRHGAPHAELGDAAAKLATELGCECTFILACTHAALMLFEQRAGDLRHGDDGGRAH